jgi:hypothetical protein
MSTTPEQPSQRPAIERAEELLDHLGQRFARARERMGTTLAQGTTAGAGETPPARVRAEELLDRAGERLGYTASTVGLRLRQWTARAREEAEDLWAEAQSRRQNTNGGQQ